MIPLDVSLEQYHYTSLKEINNGFFCKTVYYIQKVKITAGYLEMSVLDSKFCTALANKVRLKVNFE